MARRVEITCTSSVSMSFMLSLTQLKTLAEECDITTAMLRRMAREGTLLSEHGGVIDAWLQDNYRHGEATESPEFSDVEVYA